MKKERLKNIPVFRMSSEVENSFLLKNSVNLNLNLRNYLAPDQN